MKPHRIAPSTARALLAGVLLHYGSGMAPGADWRQWRGPERSNVSPETGLLRTWPPGGPPALWHARGLGSGIQPVSVAEGRAYVTGTDGDTEVLFALDAETGAQAWAVRLGPTVSENALMRWLTQRSPTLDGDRLHLLTRRGVLQCRRTSDGALLWERDYAKEFQSPPPVWGYSDHPLVDGDRLICTPFGTGAFIVALDRTTGQPVWQTALESPPKAGHAALVVSEAAGIRQYVVFHARGLSGFAASDGRLLWDYPRPRTRVASSFTPLVSGDRIVSPNGYAGGWVGLQLQRDGDSDRITVTETVRLEYSFNPFQDNTALYQGHVYLGLSPGIPACLDFATGELRWKAPPPEKAGVLALTLADGHLYLRFASGVVLLAEASPDGFHESGRFQIPDHQPSIGVTSPVIAGRRLYLRDDDRLHCFDLSTNPPANPRPAAARIVLAPPREDPNPAGYRPSPPRTGRDRAPDAVFVPTPQDVVERMLDLAGGTKETVWIDLGSGDGRIVIAAAERFGCRAIGYEIDPRLVEASREAVARRNLAARVRIEHEDLFTQDLSGADVVTVFLYPRLMERLRPLLARLKPGSRILSHQFEMPGVKPDQVVEMESRETGDRHRILVWTTPLKPTE